MTIGCRMLPVPASFSGEPPLSRPQQAQSSRVPSAAPPHPPLAPSTMGAGAPPDRSDPFESVTKRMALKRQCIKEPKEELRRRQEERKREVKLPAPIPRLPSPELENPDRPVSPERPVSHPSPPPNSRQFTEMLNSVNIVM
ncbi:unnamed protein product [Cyprideis torosa]|uniref:Uncharacterized protein n=1 Tax=Cyprideis torosa TaxID=163714 RepID=A0A7R8WIW8_9CRUS|nr:unnamed protein product [Cyprideis torosa]CAG0899346.1 unnamed protein product [Cyprideis torosa]